MDKINFYNLCRICLNDSHSYSNIFEEHLRNGCFVYEILNDVYDLDIFSGDGLPEFVCVECLGTIQSFILFVRKVHKGRLALAHLKQELDKSDSAPVLLKSEVLAFQRDVDRQGEVITTQTCEHSSSNVGPTSSNAEVITADTVPSHFTIKEEPLREEEMGYGTCEYPAAAVLPTSPNAEVITSDLITSEITIKEESMEITIKPEDVISYCSSDEVCDDPFGEPEAQVGSAPASLKCEELPLNRDDHPKEVVDGGSSTDSCEEGNRLEVPSGVAAGSATAPGKADEGETGRFVCCHCKKVLTTRRGYRRHMEAHENGRSHQCILCNKKFSRKEHLRRHFFVHSGEKPHTCTHCNQQFKRKEHLRRHLTLHTGRKTYSCVRCNKQFSRMEHLKIHVKNSCGGRRKKLT